MHTQSACWRFGVAELKEPLAISGRLIDDTCVSFCLWSYDYDIDSHDYELEGYVEFKYAMTLDEVRQLPFFCNQSFLCLSRANADDIEFFNALHVSLRGGWQSDKSTISSQEDTDQDFDVDLISDEVLPPEHAPLARHGAHCCLMEEDETNQ